MTTMTKDPPSSPDCTSISMCVHVCMFYTLYTFDYVMLQHAVRHCLYPFVLVRLCVPLWHGSVLCVR